MIREKTYIYGKHAITEALLHAPKAVEKIFLDRNFPDATLHDLIKKSAVAIEALNPDSLPQGVDRLAVHQGVIGIVSLPNLIRPYKEFISNLEVTPDTSLIVLGELQDPQNVGAVIRSAAAFGVAGILIPEHNQAGITASVVKVSAGMAFKIPLITIGNVNTTVRDLKDKKFWIYGLDEKGTQIISEEGFEAPTVFILGNEATGIREKTRELCDILLTIPMSPRCESLNAAASAAIALYAWSAKHPKALKGK